ncbi:MAG: hypothetical protein KA451_11790, partial [Methyloversatilis sp.]|nr:hypothetical protein [Methyloversatilis sp.]
PTHQYRSDCATLGRVSGRRMNRQRLDPEAHRAASSYCSRWVVDAGDLVGLYNCCDGRADLGVRFPLEVARCTETFSALIFGDEKFRYLVDY